MSLRPGTQAAARKKSYKAGVDVVVGRRRRERNLVEIRKAKREDNLVKKRRPEHVQASHHPPNESPALAAAWVDTKDDNARTMSRCMILQWLLVERHGSFMPTPDSKSRFLSTNFKHWMQ